MDYKVMRKFFCDVISQYLDEVEDKFSKDYKRCFRIRRKERDIRLLHFFYQKERSKFYRYMEESVHALDGHKVASCFIYALLKHKFIKVCRISKRNLPEKLLLANEYLAVTVALNVVAMYRRKLEGEDSSYELLIPPSKHDTEKEHYYVPLMCRALYYLRSSSNGFDCFAYANIMFLLETYTDMLSARN